MVSDIYTPHQHTDYINLYNIQINLHYINAL